ncbi:MAG: copper chaperone PCu(A)C [Streptosporangiaceae bacterium]
MLVSGRARSWAWRAAAALVCALAAMVTVSGCGAVSSMKIAVASAYIPQPTTPGTTVAYLDIRNNATHPDQLVSVSTSVGGKVGFLAPDGMSSSGTMIMKLVQDISVPPDSLLRMNPNSYRLRITGAGPMQGGKDIILTLKFAHAGMVNVVALVTNPASGGSSYFLN